MSVDDQTVDHAAAAIRSTAEMFDIPGQAVIGTTIEGKIVYWGDTASDMYGWSATEAIGRDILTITPSDLSRDAAAQIMQALGKGQTWTGDFNVRHRDGRELLAHVRDVPVRDQHGTIIGIVGISSPIVKGRQPRRRPEP